MTRQGTYHAVARCFDCKWEKDDHVNGVLKSAHNHASKKKHKVEVELGIIIDGTKPNPMLQALGIEECPQSPINGHKERDG